MKKVLFNVLMISAMVVLASCGSKSNSNEASEATEEESVAKVEFADPAIVFEEGIDISSYFAAESVSQPTIYTNSSGYYNYSINVKLKLLKKLDILEVEDDYARLEFIVKFCDKSGSMIASGYETKYEKRAKVTEMKEGTILSLDIISNQSVIMESEIEQKIKTIEKIEVGITTYHYKLKSEG